MTTIELKYKKPLVGKYNRSIFRCLNCDFSFYDKNLNITRHGNIFDNIKGFNESNIGLVAMWECPICFSKWFYHGYDHYIYFLEAVKNGTQKFFK